MTQRTKYALNALFVLAEAPPDQPMAISDLAARGRLPKKFLEAILLELKRRGILSSKKGKGGGYQLLRSPQQISLAEIMRIFDGPLAPLPCASETAFKKCDECESVTTCAVRGVMKDVRDAMAAILEKATLAQLVQQRRDLARRAERDVLYQI
jgi:Rrf2 family protein